MLYEVITMTLLTSWHMLAGRAKVQPGQLVLIMGGASGVGSFGIQIAKLFGCTVIATASADKLDKLIELGADFAVDVITSYSIHYTKLYDFAWK